ncbi:MAG: alpha/beta fold hydrolase [bacterium]|nr:alpha/beta fold hydrolase [bacterium]
MSEVRKLWIPGPEGRLEAALRVAASPRAVAVVAHPHPQHGGTLHNPVVFHAERELHRAGMTTLRFNFRGTGSSEGTHDEGRGEVEDVAAAASWLRGLAPAVPLVLVGYSFGSICSIRHALHDRTISGVVAIGLPLRRYSVDELARLARPFAVVQGTSDEFGTPAEVEPALDRMVPPGRLLPIDGAPHLFPGRAPEVGLAVVDAVDRILTGLSDG